MIEPSSVANSIIFVSPKLLDHDESPLMSLRFCTLIALIAHHMLRFSTLRRKKGLNSFLKVYVNMVNDGGTSGPDLHIRAQAEYNQLRDLTPRSRPPLPGGINQFHFVQAGAQEEVTNSEQSPAQREELSDEVIREMLT